MGRTYTVNATFVSSKKDDRQNLVHCFKIDQSLYDELEKLAELSRIVSPYRCWFTSDRPNEEAMALAPDVFGDPNHHPCFIKFTKNELTTFPNISKGDTVKIVFSVSYFSTKDIKGFSAKLLSVI